MYCGAVKKKWPIKEASLSVGMALLEKGSHCGGRL